MRVLMLDQTGQMGGAEFAMLELCERAPFDWRAILFADGPFREKLAALGKPVDIVSSADVNSVRKDSQGRSTLAVLKGMASIVSRIVKQARSCDVIYANTQKAMVVGGLAGFLARRPVVWYLHDIVTPEHFGTVQLQLVKWMTRLFLTQVVCNSEASRLSLCALTGRPQDAYPVVYNGIAAEPFDAAAAESKADLRASLGLPADAFLVGCFSRLAPWKGQHVLLDAIAKDASSHAVLVGAPFFGEEPYAAALRTQATSLGILDRVHFVGFCQEVPRMMRAMDVVAHTSTAAEPFGRVVVEGMLAGRPVIGTKAGGVTEILDDQVTGLLVPPNDADALAMAITTLRSSPEMADRIAEAGRDKARTAFTPAEHCRKMSEAISRNARPRVHTGQDSWNAPAGQSGVDGGSSKR